jgi:hypothetical protein
MRNKSKLIFIPVFIAGLFIISFVVMYLWNWLIPSIFQWSKISYLQALGLFVLSRILFGGFHFKGRRNNVPPFSNPKFKENFMKMSEEEKRIFKEQWRQRCGK